MEMISRLEITILIIFLIMCYLNNLMKIVLAKIIYKEI